MRTLVIALALAAGGLVAAVPVDASPPLVFCPGLSGAPVAYCADDPRHFNCVSVRVLDVEHRECLL